MVVALCTGFFDVESKFYIKDTLFYKPSDYGVLPILAP